MAFHLALCCNGTLLPGLHATLGSLVRRLGNREGVSLTLFWQDVAESERAALRGTISDAGGVGALEFREADTSQFRGLRTLHGDGMTYLRLLLPQLLPEAATILYLDSDLVVDTDVCALFRLELGDHPVGAVETTKVALTLDRDFLRQTGLQDDDYHFNCGVLLINAELWRSLGVTERALQMAREHSAVLTSHDQSVLVALFSRHFARIPKAFNKGVSPLRAPLIATDCIFHFVGSPKPWDPFGRFAHGNWRIWRNAIAPTRFRWRDFLSDHFPAYCRRAWSLRKSYLRALQRRKRGSAEMLLASDIS